LTNVKELILSVLKDKGLDEDDVEAIHLGAKGWEMYEKDEATVVDSLDALDYEADMGYGGENAHSFYIYTEDWILVKGTYDGSEWVHDIPRNPDKSVVPTSIGG
jgi:hypothetical protein